MAADLALIGLFVIMSLLADLVLIVCSCATLWLALSYLLVRLRLVCSVAMAADLNAFRPQAESPRTENL